MTKTHSPPEHLMIDFAELRGARVGCKRCNRWVWGEDAAVAQPKIKNAIPIYSCWPSCAAVGAADGRYPNRRLL